MPELPRYKVIEKAFFAPNLVEVGSIIETEAPPGPHLVPLNKAAAKRMEAWYTMEVDEVDPKTKLKTGAKVRPNERFRRQSYVPAEQQTAEVLAGPTKEDVTGQSLSEIMAARKSTDQRPAPAKSLKGVPTMDELLSEGEAEGEPEGPTPTASIISAAKPAIQATKSVPG